jgi:hypothetical protein
MNPYQMVLHRPVETTVEFGKFGYSGLDRHAIVAHATPQPSYWRAFLFGVTK